MSALSIGLSGLTANQLLIALAGQNIANAATPGYHRQAADLRPRSYGLPLGDGVQIAGIRRFGDSLLDDAVTQNNFDLQNVTTQLGNMQQLQSLLASGNGSLDQLLGQFFNQLEQLSAKPSDQAQRQVVLNSAVGLTNGINGLRGNIAQVKSGLDSQLQQVVNQINALTPQIADLNGQIQRATSQGLTVNELQDQRDQLISQLSDFADVRTINQDLGQKTVLAGGVPLVIGNQSTALEFTVDAKNQAVIATAGTPQNPLTVTGGQAGGLLTVRNSVLPNYQNRLDTLAQRLVTGLDGVHATGIPLSGPLTQLTGQRAVRNASVPLANAQVAFPPQAGTLTVSITDQATGQRTTHALAIDPATQSLQDVAAAFSSIPHLQGVVNTQTNTLSLIAQPGYGFDFAGRLSTQPDTSAITGTASPQIAGTYTGTTNDAYTFNVVGTGTVGVTPNLSLQVKNSSGQLLGTYNIGEGYSPGSDLPDINGVVAQLGAGTVNNGDQFGVQVTAKPDTSGILTALGINTLFVGDQASNLSVRPDLVANPQLLAGSRTGQAGDASNIQSLVKLRDTPLLANGSQTFVQYYSRLVGDVGTTTKQLGQDQAAKQVLDQQLRSQQQSIEGVDVNEELVRLSQFQQSFQATSKYLNVVDQTMDDLINIITVR